MKITEIINSSKPSLSFEVFPPKRFENLEEVSRSVSAIAALKPGYMSVTYGAGGSTDVYTPEIASLVASHGVTPLAHLTCVGCNKEKIALMLLELKERGIKNILALRGDIPDGKTTDDLTYRYASELVADIRNFGGFCIGGACYPEGHPESINRDADVENMKKKIDAGCEFLTTQMFFDNRIIYDYMERLSAAGISLPVVPGIMPITNASQVKRIVAISGNELPGELIKITEKYADDSKAMYDAGIEFATEQILELYRSGFNAIHVYSMNKPDVAAIIQRNLKGIVL